jgi:hypothetical protein
LYYQKNITALPESVIIQLSALSEHDIEIIRKCRGKHNRLGFAYQLMFVKIFNRFPNQVLLEIQTQILTFASLQLSINAELINAYQKRQPTISEHQQKIRNYLNLKSFDEVASVKVNDFLFMEAQRIEHTSILLAKV